MSVDQELGVYIGLYHTMAEERDGLAEVVAMQADLIAQLQADNLTLARYVRQGHDYPGMLKALERIFGK